MSRIPARQAAAVRSQRLPASVLRLLLQQLLLLLLLRLQVKRVMTDTARHRQFANSVDNDNIVRNSNGLQQVDINNLHSASGA